MQNILLVSIALVDCVQLLSPDGKDPRLVESLMTICEVFGACIPNVSSTMLAGGKVTAHSENSDHPPIEYGAGYMLPKSCQLTREQLLLKEEHSQRQKKGAAKAMQNLYDVKRWDALQVNMREHLRTGKKLLTDKKEVILFQKLKWPRDDELKVLMLQVYLERVAAGDSEATLSRSSANEFLSLGFIPERTVIQSFECLKATEETETSLDLSSAAETFMRWKDEVQKLLVQKSVRYWEGSGA
ncbi:unnamed protein product [Cuscuta europaea]|uniref:Uncharacterized protein n=1 Tax=Cuscuta europaea TaxID=41803 RepID=A0A9P0ZW14_CUSEU|nr:unnamed protein product [Cuscuta europaea]